jgi:hypothetical protein
MRTSSPAHLVTYERETKEIQFKGWSERQMTDKARAHCTCGRFDTGMVDAVEADAAAKEHARAFADDGAGPVRPDEEPTT